MDKPKPKQRVSGVQMPCAMCGRIFSRYTRAYCGRRVGSLRRSNAITCSKNCSKLLMRKNSAIKSRLRDKKRKNEQAQDKSNR